MMHRSGSNSNMVGGCSCTRGMYHTTLGNSFSMLFSKNSDGYHEFDEGEMCSFATNSSPSSVDCTLSLGTPSTRLSNEKKRSSCMPASGFGWNNFPSKHMSPPSSTVKNHREGDNGNSGRDPLLSRRCANCDTTSTPLWRNGPRGPKSLCNACGIRFKKEERRAMEAASITSSVGGGNSQNVMNDSWAAPPQKTVYYPSSSTNELRLAVEDNHRSSISWRFNAADRPSLVHNYTS